ncbi:MAG: ASCH/PUA domain-containing protein, partial [Candidatus Cryosericum sp.]
MRTHQLKTWPSFFEAILSGEKTFEVRQNDRDFAVGDALVLQEWDPAVSSEWGSKAAYTGRTNTATVTYVLRGGEFGIERGHCVLGIRAGHAKDLHPDFGQWAQAHTHEIQKLIDAVDGVLTHFRVGQVPVLGWPELKDAREKLEERFPRKERQCPACGRMTRDSTAGCD